MSRRHVPLWVAICLALYLGVYLANAWANYCGAMGFSTYQYLMSARALLEGKLTLSNEIFDLLKTSFPDVAAGKVFENSIATARINPQGELVSVVSIGITLVSALFLWLFSEYAVFAMPVVYDLMLLAGLFLLTFMVTAREDRRQAWVAGLLSVAVYGTVVNFRLSPLRDWLCTGILALVSVAVYHGMKKKRWMPWYLAFALICFASIVKVTYVLFFVPWALSLFVSGTITFDRTLLRHGAVLALLATVIFLPFFVQNHVGTGHWYLPVQYFEAKYHVPREAGVFAYLAGNLRAIIHAQAHVFSPNGLPLWFAGGFLAVVLIGAIDQRKSPFFHFWIVPFLLLVYGFYSSTSRQPGRYNVYLSPVYPLVVFLFVRGLLFSIRGIFDGPLRNVPHKSRWHTATVSVLALLSVMPFLLVKAYRTVPGNETFSFQVSEAHRLVSELETVVPEGSVLLCDHYLSHTIDYYSHAYSFPPECLDAPESPVTEKIGYLLSHGTKVFFCDYQGVKGSTRFLNRINDHYLVRKVKEGQRLYGFFSVHNAPPFDVYEIERKSKT